MPLFDGSPPNTCQLQWNSNEHVTCYDTNCQDQTLITMPKAITYSENATLFSYTCVAFNPTCYCSRI